jgi:nucleotide-binding universal stress UspA family protein
MARQGAKKLTVVFIEEMTRYPGAPSETNEDRERGDATFARLRAEALEAGARSGIEIVAEKRVGHPAQGLVHYVRDTRADLLVIGHSGHSRLWGTFLGTTADKVVRHATCSVLVVR